MRAEQGFQPAAYTLLHSYRDDLVLPSLLERLLPDNIRAGIEAHLIQWGDDLHTGVREAASLAVPRPSVTQYDQWGERVDLLHTSEGWRTLKAIGTSEGLVSIFYEREKFGEYARIFGFAKTVMWTSDSRMVGCPLSMTDGCARVLELVGTDEMKRTILPRLTSQDPSLALTSGQWMTERPGGSDVSQTETVATLADNDASSAPTSALGVGYRLSGFKWFSSATDGDVALALARTGPPEEGSRSLSLFLVPLRLPILDKVSPRPQVSVIPLTPRSNNGILIHRMKNKIGTHDLPTAELSLEGSLGFLVGSLNNGVKAIAPVLNITRVHSAVHGVGNLARSLLIARSYAAVRRVGSVLLMDMPLHTATLAKVSILYRALLHFTFGVAHLLGKSEAGTASNDENVRLRLLTPIVKGFAAHYAVSGMEECMVALGGQGYMEENEIGRLIRDSLVEKIWEGTPNVLALDVLRASRDGKSTQAFVHWGRSLILAVPQNLLDQDVELTTRGLTAILDSLQTFFASGLTNATIARPLLFLVGHLASSLYLLEHAVWSFNRAAVKQSGSGYQPDVKVFTRWAAGGSGQLNGSGGWDGSGLWDTKREIETLIKVTSPQDRVERLDLEREVVYGSAPVRGKL